MLKTKIFADRISNLTDARYFAAWGVDWLSFSLIREAEAYLPPQEIVAIREWVSGPKLIGEFGDAEAEDVKKAVELLRLDALLVTTVEDPAMLESLSEVEKIKKIILSENSDKQQIETSISSWSSYVSHFILDFSTHGYDWISVKAGDCPLPLDTLRRICGKYPVFLDVDCEVAMLNELLDLPVAGLVLKGGEEEEVGLKSFDEIDEILEALEC